MTNILDIQRNNVKKWVEKNIVLEPSSQESSSQESMKNLYENYLQDENVSGLVTIKPKISKISLVEKKI